MIAITERDIWVANAAPRHVEYLISEQTITVPNQPTQVLISPAWLGRVKQRLEELILLQPNWDSYGGAPVDPRVVQLATSVVEWFAVADMPPPDVFAMSDAGVQIEWHVRQVNIEIDISPLDGTTIYFDDLHSGQRWSRRAASSDLQKLRRRLLEPL
jgi:hypothetical protein